MERKSNSAVWQYILIIIACILCYGTTLSGQFVFDDSVAIVQNTDVTNGNRSVMKIFQHDFWGYNITDQTSHKSYRPLTILTFHWEHRIFGRLEPTYMKIVNFILHCFICCLMLNVFNKLFDKQGNGKWIFYGTMLFAIHPIHTEAVAGIVGRAELLCSIGFLMAILIFFKIEKYQKRNFVQSILWYGLLIALTTAAVLCKETGITILPMCAAYDIIVNTNIQKAICLKAKLKIMDKNIINRIVILSIATFMLVFIRLWIMDFESPKFKKMDNPIAAADSVLTKILSQNFLYSLNLWLLICPDWLSFDWALGSLQLIESPGDIRIIPIVLMYLLFILIIFKGTNNTHLSFAFLIIPFLPASGIVKLGFVIAERILYIPSIGFCMLISIGYDHLCQYFKQQKYIFQMCYIFLLITMCLKTRSRAFEWTNEELLFKSALRVCPNNAKVYYNIARLASDRNDRVTAFQYYHKAISLYPEYEAATMNLGNLYREINELETAEKYLLRSVELLEEFSAAWMNLGIVQAARKKYNESLKSYSKALNYRKRYATCHYNMGNLYIELNQSEDALYHWREAVNINPKLAKAWANILAFLDNSGRIKDVLQTAEIAIVHVPNDPAILFTIANAWGKMERFQEAEAIYKKIIHLKPNHALYHVNLGVLYHRWNRKIDAITAYRNALKIDPTLRSASDNLNRLTKNVNN